MNITSKLTKRAKEKVIDIEAEETPAWPEPQKKPEQPEITDVIIDKKDATDSGKKTSTRLKIYSLTGCFLLLLLVRALNMTAQICAAWLNHTDVPVPGTTNLSLRIPPFFYALPIIFTFTVLLGIFRKSERILIDSLAFMLFVSIIIVLFQTLGIVTFFAATISG